MEKITLLNGTEVSVDMESKKFKFSTENKYTSTASKSEMFKLLYDGGAEISEIAKMTGSHYSFVYGVISANREVRTTKKSGKSDLFRTMFDEGKKVGEIAKETNSNYSFVFSVIKKYKESKLAQ